MYRVLSAHDAEFRRGPTLVQVVVARRGDDLSAAVRADEEEVTRLVLDLVEVDTSTV
jgi:hypothetical protein